MSVTFPSGRTAAVVEADASAAAEDVLRRLGLEPDRPVLVAVGGADTLEGDAYAVAKRVVAPAVARAAALTGAAVVDGGTDSGVMAAVGRAIGERRDETVLLGVAPAQLVAAAGSPAAANGDKTPLEPNHTHFVLTEGAEWGSETRLLVDVSDALAGTARVVMVVAGGGTVARKEVLEATKRGWPVFVVAGTGGVADELAPSLRRGGARGAGEETSEILEHGDLRLFEAGDPGELARRLAWELQNAEVLKLAWKRFATYDALAVSARKTFERLQSWILGLGILATFVALLKAALGIGANRWYSWVDDALHWTVVALPILVAILIGLAYRLASGNRWVLLRGAAETIKREIYRYRTATGEYGAGNAVGPEEQLSIQLESIETKLLQTAASGAELTPYSGPLPPRMFGASADDDGLSPLDADRYLELRVGDQLGYYHPRVASLARTRRRFQLAVLLAGGVGAVLAAAGAEVWVGLTTTIAAAALAYLHYLQIENTLVAFNQAAGKLESLRTKWRAIPAERRDPKAFDALVADAEVVLATEVGGWVLQMTEALEELQTSQLEGQRKAGIEQPKRDG